MSKKKSKTLFSGYLITIVVIVIVLFILFNIDKGSNNNVNKLNTELALIHKIGTTRISINIIKNMDLQILVRIS